MSAVTPATSVRSQLVGVLSAVLLTAVSAGCSGGDTETAGQSSTGPLPPVSTAVAGSVWVADETGNSLTVLDAAGNTVATTLTGIHGPHNVQVGRDGATVYATSVGADAVVAIDAATYQVAATAPTGSHPAHVIEAPNGKVYVADSGDGTVSIFQSRTLQSLGRIEVGGMPHGLRAAADGSVIVVANHMTGAVDVIDAHTDQMRFSVPVGTGPAQVAPDHSPTICATIAPLPTSARLSPVKVMPLAPPAMSMPRVTESVTTNRPRDARFSRKALAAAPSPKVLARYSAGSWV